MGRDARKQQRDRPAYASTQTDHSFVIHISKLAKAEISFFYLFSVAEETDFNLALLEAPKKGLLHRGPNMI